MHIIRVFLVFAATAACTGDGGELVTIELTHDACAPLALIAAAPTTTQHDGMQAAQELWRNRGAPALGRRADSLLEVRFEDASRIWHGQYNDSEGVIYINRGIDDRALLSIVIAHELGHAFGLQHIDDRPSVMNRGNLSVAPNEDDQRALEAIWGTCE